ncbi:hypothetical protein BEH76_18740 [Shewanella algae]|nr:hypothetical protein BEH76_18740 [Shewanella algae]
MLLPPMQIFLYRHHGTAVVTRSSARYRLIATGNQKETLFNTFINLTSTSADHILQMWGRNLPIQRGKPSTVLGNEADVLATTQV